MVLLARWVLENISLRVSIAEMSMRTVSSVLLILYLGCGAGGGDLEVGGSGGDDTAIADQPVEQGPDEPTGDDGESGDAGPDEDISLDDVAGEPEPVDPCPGAPGCACLDEGECDNGLCVPNLSGMECATPCETAEDCPAGWDCGVDGDSVDHCMAPFRLCRPCLTDLECTHGGTFKDFCFEFGPSGRFCVTECSGDSPCPGGYSCTQVTHGRAILTVCLPTGGNPCPCTTEYVEKGYLTICYLENEFGRCEVQKTCDAACSAPDPAPEKCNGIDDDCSGATDDGIGTLGCFKSNEFGSCAGISECIDGSFDNCSAVEPLEETCNMADDDCDGLTDNGIEPIICEITNEWGTCVGLVECQNGTFEGCEVEEPAAEACDDEDNDCDGDTDEEGAEGCTEYCADIDTDGWGQIGDVQCLCEPAYPYTATLCGDCNDLDPGIGPGATEVCNGKDDSCDGVTDEEDAAGCIQYYFDNDGDGYSLTGTGKCLCEPFGKFTAMKLGDCNDTNVSVNPGAVESCNGIDDDCDGGTDEELPGC